MSSKENIWNRFFLQQKLEKKWKREELREKKVLTLKEMNSKQIIV